MQALAYGFFFNPIFKKNYSIHLGVCQEKQGGLSRVKILRVSVLFYRGRKLTPKSFDKMAIF